MPPFVEVTLTRSKTATTRGHQDPPRASDLEDDHTPGPPGHHAAPDPQRPPGPDADRADLRSPLPRPHRPQPKRRRHEPTRSELERKLLPTLQAAGLPRPLVNHRLGRYTIDFLWPDQKLVVETDGWAGHGHRVAFERDRARDADLQAQGFAVLRFTWRQVMHETLLVTVRIAQLLSRTPHRALATPPAGG